MSSTSDRSSPDARRAHDEESDLQDLEIVIHTQHAGQQDYQHYTARQRTPQLQSNTSDTSPTLVPHATPPLEDPFTIAAVGSGSHARSRDLSSFHNRCISVASSSGSLEAPLVSSASRSASHAASIPRTSQQLKIPSTMFAVSNNAGANAQAGPDLPEITTEV